MVENKWCTDTWISQNFKKGETEAESNISKLKLFADMLFFKNSKWASFSAVLRYSDVNPFYLKICWTFWMYQCKCILQDSQREAKWKIILLLTSHTWKKLNGPYSFTIQLTERSWYAPFQSSQTRQQLFMFSFCHVFPIDDRNHKLPSSFYLMTSKSNLWSYSHGSLLLLKYLMLYIFFVRQCSPKIPLNTQKHETSVLVEYFTRGVEQTVK